MSPAVPAPPSSHASRATRDELRATIALALPIVLVQLGTMLMGVVDTIIVGHLSPQALAAVALGNLYFTNVTIVGTGLLLALDPVIAQAVGAGDDVGVARGVQRGLVLAVALALVLALPLVPSAWVLARLGQPADVVPSAGRYLVHSIPGVLPFVAFGIVRQALQALHRTRAIVVTIVVANVVNAFLDWVLVFGRLGSPAFGVVGSAWATAVSRWVMLLLVLRLAWPELRPYLRPWHPETLAPAPLRRIARLGAPIGFQQLLEVSAFGAIGLLMGRLGTREMASHQIALNLASLTFMVPLGVAAAAAVRVGHAIGAGDPARTRGAARAALVSGVGFMSCTAGAFLLFPAAIAGVYTRDATVVALAAILIPIAGVFQVFDGVQAVSAGILRGAGDTRAPLVVNLLGFWLVGIPVSAFLAFGLQRGAIGLWWGLVAGLAAVAVFLLARVVTVLRRGVRRVEIERDARMEMEVG